MGLLIQQQQQQHQQQGFNSAPGPIRKPQPPPPQTHPNLQNLHSIQTQDVEMKTENSSEGAPPSRPHWMKNKLSGVKKVSNKERRRRQNENLRRLLTPKNALMALNEMLPNEQLANQFKVDLASTTLPHAMKQQQHTSFCADLNVAGNNYKGFGENKLTARNAAAEQAIRDIVIKKMNKVLMGEAAGSTGTEVEEEDEDPLPMIQLASFALHKLFSEWEVEGHKVPTLKPNPNSVSEGNGAPTEPPVPKNKPPKTARDLPLNASQMHPCMLLTYMRPCLEYRELAVEGDRPQNMMFTMGVDVDAATYVGKATNKKEARRQAAKAACSALFGVTFADVATENTPVTMKQ